MVSGMPNHNKGIATLLILALASLACSNPLPKRAAFAPQVITQTPALSPTTTPTAVRDIGTLTVQGFWNVHSIPSVSADSVIGVVTGDVYALSMSDNGMVAIRWNGGIGYICGRAFEPLTESGCVE
jgi:hypothetical protein